jgi:isopentenyl-diphosphate Delta-isomerase
MILMEEMIDIVDENDKKLGVMLKGRVHANGIWHRSSHVWILNDDRILLQKRADSKIVLPGRFDVSCGGHAVAGESPTRTAVRELKEELGLDVSEGDLKFFEKRKQITVDKEKKLVCKSIVSVFLLPLNLDVRKLRLEPSEVSEARFFDLDELDYLFNNKPKMFIDDVEYLMDMVYKIRKMQKKK